MGGQWVGRRRLIILHYFKSGWLIIDFVSVFPFYAIGWALDNRDGDGLETLRMIKLLRLLKLARCLKAGEIGKVLSDDRSNMPFEVMGPRGDVSWFEAKHIELAPKGTAYVETAETKVRAQDP